MEEDPLACPKCLNRFHERNFIPKILECGHSFCDRCTKKLWNSIKACHVCEIKMTKSEHPTNLHGLQLLKLYKTDPHVSAAINALDCRKEVREVKVKSEKKLGKLSQEIKNRETLKAKLTDQLDEKQKLLEALQRGFEKLELFENQGLKDFDTPEAMQVLAEIKSLDAQYARLMPELGPASKIAARKQERSLARREARTSKSKEGTTPRDRNISTNQVRQTIPLRLYVGEVFLQLATESDTVIMIRLVSNPRTAQFAHLCTAEHGPCYKGTILFDKRYENWGWGSLLFRVENYIENGRKGRGAIVDFSGTYEESEYKEGEVVIIAYNDGSFSIVKLTTTRSMSSIIGVVGWSSAAALESLPKGPFKIAESGTCCRV